MNGNITAMYFSPTHGTQKLVRAVADELAQKTGKEQMEIDLTLPRGRGKAYGFGPDDILLFGFPVYGGRIPKLPADELSKLKGDNSLAVIVAAYGNRDYDDAILEAKEILTGKGFIVIAAGAFIAEHSYSYKLAADRPDENDLASTIQFAQQISDKLAAGNTQDASVKGKIPYKDHMPAMPFLPKTKDTCTGCMICVEGCPVAVISEDDPKTVKPGCIQCHACVKSCPVKSKYFDAETIAKAAAMLENNFMIRKEPEFFI